MTGNPNSPSEVSNKKFVISVIILIGIALLFYFVGENFKNEIEELSKNGRVTIGVIETKSYNTKRGFTTITYSFYVDDILYEGSDSRDEFSDPGDTISVIYLLGDPDVNTTLRNFIQARERFK